MNRASRQRLHGTGSVWNRYEIGTEKPCVCTGPVGSGTDRICFLVPNGSTYEVDPIWNRTVPVSNRTRVNRVVCTTVDPVPNGSEHIEPRVNVAHTANASKLIEKYFLVGEMRSQIKKILKFFSQNKKNKLTEKNFLVPSARKSDLNLEHISKQD